MDGRVRMTLLRTTEESSSDGNMVRYWDMFFRMSLIDGESGDQHFCIIFQMMSSITEGLERRENCEVTDVGWTIIYMSIVKNLNR